MKVEARHVFQSSTLQLANQLVTRHYHHHHQRCGPTRTVLVQRKRPSSRLRELRSANTIGVSYTRHWKAARQFCCFAAGDHQTGQVSTKPGSVEDRLKTITTFERQERSEDSPRRQASSRKPQDQVFSSSNAASLKTFPNGLVIQSVSPADVDFIYHEIWDERSYLQHGISIGPGDTVVDVGANIGLFTLQAAKECPGGRVLSFEPIPSVFDALWENVARNTGGADFTNVEIANAGLSDGRLAQAEFTFYEQASGWSTMCQDEPELMAAMELFLARALSTGEGVGGSKMAPVGTWLQQRAPPAVFKALARLYVRWMLSSATKAICPLYTLSQIIRERDIQQIDLLKIDVERAELDVLNGIEQSDWPRIKQVVLEVHDIDGRLERVVNILKSAGLDQVVLEQSKTLEDSTLYNLYAKRTLPAN